MHIELAVQQLQVTLLPIAFLGGINTQTPAKVMLGRHWTDMSPALITDGAVAWNIENGGVAIDTTIVSMNLFPVMKAQRLIDLENTTHRGMPVQILLPQRSAPHLVFPRVRLSLLSILLAQLS